MKKTLHKLLLNSIEIHAPIYDWDIDGCRDVPCSPDIPIFTSPESIPDYLNARYKYELPSPLTNRL